MRRHTTLAAPNRILTLMSRQLAAIVLFFNEGFMLSFPCDLVIRREAMLTDTFHQPRTDRHSHRFVSNPNDRPAPRARRTRAHWRWRIFGRRDAITTSQRCLALHMLFAGPHSALE